MACPICNHTMSNLRDVIFWCPRCGTIADHSDGGMYERPKLVEACRKYENEVLVAGEGSITACSLWYRLGIEAAINVPTARPPLI